MDNLVEPTATTARSSRDWLTSLGTAFREVLVPGANAGFELSILDLAFELRGDDGGSRTKQWLIIVDSSGPSSDEQRSIGSVFPPFELLLDLTTVETARTSLGTGEDGEEIMRNVLVRCRALA